MEEYENNGFGYQPAQPQQEPPVTPAAPAPQPESAPAPAPAPAPAAEPAPAPTPAPAPAAEPAAPVQEETQAPAQNMNGFTAPDAFSPDNRTNGFGTVRPDYTEQSPYSPYVAPQPNNYGAPGNNYAPYTQQRPPVAPAAPAPAPKKQGNKGKNAFIIIVSLLLVLAITAVVVLAVKYRKASSTTSPLAPGVFSDEDDTSSKKSKEKEAEVSVPAMVPKQEKDALTTAEIAAKGRESCVGVIVYYDDVSAFTTTKEAGQGTGILAFEDETGTYTYVLTCAHVIKTKGVSVKVQLEDGKSFDAEIVGYDTQTDVAVLRIKASGLKCAEFGDTKQLAVGSSVYAVGNPGGIEFFGSFTDGVVSAIDRPIDSEIGYTMNCIQHTAAINPGNSGGALVNVFGQVIGINSQKIASADYEGMGFAIPIDSALSIADSLIHYGYVPNRPKIGIQYVTMSSSNQFYKYYMIAQMNQLPAGTLIIYSISSDSTLADTDAKQYDMIVAVDGKKMDTADVLLEKIDKGKVGDKLKLTLARIQNDYSVSTFDVEVTLVEDKGVEDKTASTEPSYYNYNPFSEYGFDFGF